MPFYWGPFHWLENDPGRHWEGAKHFFEYTIAAGSDPKVFELYLYLLQQITSFNPFYINLATGILSASMPLFWYLFAKEILPKQLAMIYAILIGIFPSLLTIYGYFMNETLLLTLLGLGMWLAVRAYRKKNLVSFLFVVLVLGLASLTRMIALPIMLMCLTVLWLSAEQKIKKLLIGSVILALMYIPAAMHTYKSINFFSPFGSLAVNSIMKRSNNTMIGINYIDKQIYHTWGSPSYYNASPFEPFFNYTTPRSYDTHQIVIDTRNGRLDWDKAYNEIDLTFEKFVIDVKENFIFLFFGGTWPDNINGARHFAGIFQQYVPFHIHSRWIWLPLMVVVLLYSPLLKNEKHQFIVFLTFTLLLLMIFQQSGIMSGRFRKPLEPFMLISFFIVFHQALCLLKALIKNEKFTV